MVLLPKLAQFVRTYPEIILEVTSSNDPVDLVAEEYDAGVQLGEFIQRDMIAVRISISDWLVRRVIDDADAHHSRHSYKQDSVHTEPGESGSDGHNTTNHGFWDVVAIFPLGLCPGLHAPATDVQANSHPHAIADE